MRLTSRLALLWAMLPLAGCRSRQTVATQAMPPNTILLSHMMRELSTQPGFTETLLHQLEGAKGTGEKRGPALLTSDLVEELRKRILGKNWEGLDRFPGWTLREIDPTVRVADRMLGKNPKLEGMSAVHPGAPSAPLNDQQARVFLDLGPYPLNQAGTVSLDEPSPLPGFTTQGIVTAVTPNITRGDGPNALAPEHAESQRLADVLNRLSVNALPEAKPFRAKLGSQEVSRPEDLIAALAATGHTVRVTDSRYFANFGHLHYTPAGSKQALDVMMPFWINTKIAVPGTGGLFRRPRPLLVPVSHAEYEWHIRGPHINADISHYFGVDGKAEWRTMDTLDQAWVLKRDAHTYTGPQALEVTRLIGLITLAYMHQHAARPALPFGGYYILGVCQDPVSAVERTLTGKSTLFPNTANASLFNDPRDGEVNALFAAIPKDHDNPLPPPERVFGSLPADPGVNGNFDTISIPGLAQDLRVTYAAWQANDLQRTHNKLFYATRSFATVAVVATIFALFLRWRREDPR